MAKPAKVNSFDKQTLWIWPQYEIDDDSNVWVATSLTGSEPIAGVYVSKKALLKKIAKVFKVVIVDADIEKNDVTYPRKTVKNWGFTRDDIGYHAAE